MKKLLKKLLLGGVGAALISACTADKISEDYNSLNMETTSMEVQNIMAGDLVGTWKINSMIADTPVNLDLISPSSRDILTETDCFGLMYFTFHENGDVDTGQARLYFETADGDMKCNFQEYQAKYAVEGDDLQVTFTYNGTEITENKTIALSTTAEGEFLTVSLEYWEAQTYLPENPETPTGAANVNKIDMVYKKVQ